MLELFLQPMFLEALVTATIAGICLGLLGVYVVSRKIVFISAALAQSAALGVALSFIAIGFFGWVGVLADILPPLAGILVSFVVVFALLAVEDNPTLSRDAILGIAFIVPSALILLVLPMFPHELHEIEAVLDGIAVMVDTFDIVAIAVAAVAILAVQVYGFRGFVFASLDPVVARSQGVPVRLLNGVLFGSIALMTGLATRALGPIPTFAMTVLPGIGALGLKVGLKWVFVVAAICGGLSGALGYVVTYVTDWSVGASQALVAALLALLLRGVGWLQKTG